jgi:hypothetical protein
MSDDSLRENRSLAAVAHCFMFVRHDARVPDSVSRSSIEYGLALSGGVLILETDFNILYPLLKVNA